MKQLLLLFGMAFALLNVKAQLVDVLLEPHVIEGGISEQPEGTTTYRLYATFQNPTDRLIAVFSTADCYELEIATTTNFFNDVFGSVIGSHVNTAFFQFFPTYGADSWVTINADNSQFPDAIDLTYVESSSDGAFDASFLATEGGELSSLECHMVYIARRGSIVANRSR